MELQNNISEKIIVSIPEGTDFNKPIDRSVEVEVTNENAKQILEGCAINPHEELEPPKVCLSIFQENEEATICTLGNFSMLIGKAKSRKTFLCTMALATATKNGILFDKFQGNLPEDKNQVLFFDTEQSKHDVQKAMKRICRLSNTELPENLNVYSLRSQSPHNRLKLIENAIYNTTNVGFIVIDGIRDLITSINDEDQATMITSKLLKWTEDLGIHIMCVLHQNKGDNNARGHVGAELTNKAETVLSVTKQTDNKEISIVSAEYCRDREPQDFAFEIDENGLPRLVENFQVKAEGQRKKSLIPNEVQPEVHNDILKEVFSINKKHKYKDLSIQIQLAYNRYGKTMGESKAKAFIQYYLNQALIKKEGTEGTKSCFYSFNN